MVRYLAILALAFSVVAQASSEAERNFVHAWMKLPRFVALCLDRCELRQDEWMILRAVEENLETELSGEGLRFASEEEHPARFRRTPDGDIQVVISQRRVGSEIWVNSDWIYSSGDPFSVGEATEALLQELMTHLPDPAGSDRDLHIRAAARVGSQAQADAQLEAAVSE